MKEKIAYVNYGFLDTDITVVKELQKVYDVVWFVLLGPTEPFKENFFYEFTNGTGIELRLTKYNCRRRSLEFARILFKTVEEIKRINPVLLYTCITDFYFVFSAILRIKHIPILLGIHDVVSHSNYKDSLLLKISIRISIMNAKHILLFSKNQYQLFQQLYPSKKASLVGMSYKDFGQPLVVHKKNDKIRLLFFGTLQFYKGTDLLIQAIDELISEGVTNLQLSIYGKPGNTDFKQKCLSYITHKEFFNLHLEFVDNSDIPNIFASHDFSVFPYRDATQSGPLMINVCYGLPIIAPNHTCFSDIYNNEKDSLLYNNSHNVTDLKNSLKRLSQMNEKEINQMKSNALLLKESFSEERIGNNYIKVFSEVIERN